MFDDLPALDLRVIKESLCYTLKCTVKNFSPFGWAFGKNLSHGCFSLNGSPWR